MEQLKEILIDEKNQKAIKDLVMTINELQGRLQLIMQTIINYSKVEGNFKLSEDLLRLVKIEEKSKP